MFMLAISFQGPLIVLREKRWHNLMSYYVKQTKYKDDKDMSHAKEDGQRRFSETRPSMTSTACNVALAFDMQT